MLPVRENESSLRKWSGGTAHLRILEGTLAASRFYSAVTKMSNTAQPDAISTSSYKST